MGNVTLSSVNGASRLCVCDEKTRLRVCAMLCVVTTYSRLYLVIFFLRLAQIWANVCTKYQPLDKEIESSHAVISCSFQKRLVSENTAHNTDL